MASIEGAAAAMSKALEGQNFIADLVTGATRVMDQNSAANAGNPTREVQAEVSSALTGPGRVLDTIV
jgi:hypothetical protein